METPSVDVVQIVVLAFIQGVTEFLPISSSAHLILPSALSGWQDQGLALDIAVHLGTLLAAVVHFRRDLAGFATSSWALARRRERDDNVNMLLRIGAATVPIAVAGALFKAPIEAHLRTTTVIAVTTIAFGLALWWADRRRGPAACAGTPAWTRGAVAEKLPTYGQALLIGLAQALALVPGASRAGVTITAALALGFGRTAALRFSFLLAIPAIAGAALFAAVDADPRTMLPWPALTTGFVVAAGSAFLCVGAFLRVVEHIGMTPFAIYRVLLGLALLAFF